MFEPRLERGCVMTLGKLFTPMCLDADSLRYYNASTLNRNRVPLPLQERARCTPAGGTPTGLPPCRQILAVRASPRCVRVIGVVIFAALVLLSAVSAHAETTPLVRDDLISGVVAATSGDVIVVFRREQHRRLAFLADELFALFALEETALPSHKHRTSAMQLSVICSLQLQSVNRFTCI